MEFFENFQTSVFKILVSQHIQTSKYFFQNHYLNFLAPVHLTRILNLQTIEFEGPLIMLCQMISVECPTNFEFGATFSV